MIEPTQAQRRTLEATRGPVAVLTFLAPRDGDLSEYLARTARTVAEVSGRRTTLWIERMLAGPDLPYTMATLDWFRGSRAALQAWDAASEDRAESTSSVHALLLRTNRVAPVITRALSRLSWLFRPFAHVEEGRPVDPEAVFGDPRLLSTSEQFDALMEGDRSRPFLNLNLARFVGGEEGRRAVTKRIYDPSGIKVLGLGAHVAALGVVLGTFVGSEDEPLFDAWNDVAIAAWPSRTVFRDYMANVSPDVVEARTELMERAMQIVCSVQP